MKKVSVFHAPIQNVYKSYSSNLSEIFDKIQTDQEIKKVVTTLRSFPDKKTKDDYKSRKLEAITFSGIFSKRKAEGLITHSEILCVDIDNLSPQEMIIARDALFAIKHLLVGYFISPSGRGYKIQIKIDPVRYPQADNYIAAANFLHSCINIPKENFDKSCKDVARACFISSDPEAYLNELVKNEEGFNQIPLVEMEQWGPLKNVVYEKVINESNKNGSLNPLLRDSKLNFNKKEDQINFSILASKATQSAGEFKVGNRHNYIQLFTSYLNHFGISKDEAIKYCVNNYKSEDFEKEIVKITEDTYVRYQDQHGQWSEEEIETEMETPCFPTSLQSSLPSLIARPRSLFKGREADVFLCGMLGVLSSWIPKVGGFYDNKMLSPNLFFMISAPASSGKGILMWTRKAGKVVSEKLADQYEKALAHYENALIEYESCRKEDPTLEKPQKPLKNKFIIAGNISSAALITTLSANKYFGLVFESEADTLSNTLNNKEWGGFNDIIRRAFHNETISYSRKKDNEDIEITKAYLSMVLSGTPQQITRLVSSVENGFFSRILFYDFPNKNVWKNVFEKQEENLEKYFEAYAIRLDELLAPFFYNKSNAIEDMILFSFTPAQEERFNAWFQVKQTDLSQIYGDDIIASVRRLAVCFFRVAMILSVLRLIEDHGDDPYIYTRASTIQCSDKDYENAEAIIEVLIFHTIKIFRQVKKTNRNKYSKGKKVLLLENLPEEFDRAKAMDLAAYIGIKEKTAENYLTQFINQGMLSRVEHNHYKKVA